MSKIKFLEKTKKKNRIYKGKAINFRVDEIILPNKKSATREFMEHPGAVAILAIDKDRKIIFVKQYRYPVGKETYEIPAGKLNGKNDNYLRRALAELKEETGYIPKKIKPLVEFWPTPAFSDEILKIYLAKDLTPGKDNPDEDEFIKTEKISLSKALSLIKKGKIKDSKTIIAILYFHSFIKGELK